MGKKKKSTKQLLNEAKKMTREARRKQIKKGMSKLFSQMGLPKASKNVLRVKTKRQFKAYASVARGWYKATGGTGSKKVRRAVVLVNKLERAY